MTSHEADLQRKLQEARAEIVRLMVAAQHVDENGEHNYTSTYCLHGRHNECWMTCKICRNPCLCGCGHGYTAPPLARPWRSLRSTGKVDS